MEDPRVIARRFVTEVWNAGNLNGIAEFVAEECKLRDIVFSGAACGLDRLKDHVRACREAFPDFHAIIQRMEFERDEVVLYWTATGTQETAFLGMAPTHRKVSVNGTAILRFEGSRVAEQWVDWDLHSLLVQLRGVEQQPRP